MKRAIFAIVGISFLMFTCKKEDPTQISKLSSKTNSKTAYSKQEKMQSSQFSVKNQSLANKDENSDSSVKFNNSSSSEAFKLICCYVAKKDKSTGNCVSALWACDCRIGNCDDRADMSVGLINSNTQLRIEFLDMNPSGDFTNNENTDLSQEVCDELEVESITLLAGTYTLHTSSGNDYVIIDVNVVE